jgi:tetratricopeptide (TPR) repeat protein
MIKNTFLFLILLLFFTNCSSVHADKVVKQRTSSTNENFTLLLSLDMQMRGDVIGSTEGFKKLFLETKDPIYSVEYLRLLNYLGEFKKSVDEFEALQLPKDDIHHRELATAYFGLQDFENAKNILLKLEKLEELDYRVLGEIYYQDGKLEESLEYIEKAYEISKDPNLAVSIAKILHRGLGKLEAGIEFLQTHKKENSYNYQVSSTLANMLYITDKFGETGDIYREIYEKEGRNPEFARATINIYNSSNQIDKLISFLKDSKFNDDFLIRIYMSKKMYKEGFELSQKLYEKTKQPLLLAQNAIFEYELNHDFKTVISKLEKVVSELGDASFYNYLGYLMIDHDYRVADGVKYVKSALELDPESLYILDSLAWGQYKLGKCEEAKKNMKIVVDGFGKEDKEVNEHWEKIEKCQKR